jgi:SAM-dependent methyltransferase
VTVESSASTRDIKAAQLRHWNSVAGGWAHWYAWTERNFGLLTPWLGEATKWQPGAAILDVGCGSGYPALAAAAAVRPGGTVTAIDLSPNMLAAAARAAADRQLDNVTFQEADAESLTFADETFDAVTCVCGLMFCPDPQRAVREMRRVLEPRGRLAVVVWAEPSLNPFSMVIVGVIARFITLPPFPGAAAPGPFRFASVDDLGSVLRAASWSRITIETRAITCEFQSVDEYLDVFVDVAGWKRRRESLSDQETSRLRQALEEAVRPHVEHGRLRLVATMHCAAAEK